MKIKFTKSRQYTDLYLSFLWFVPGTYYLFLTDYTELSNYFYMAAGVAGFAVFLYNKKHQYLIIENGTITKNILYGFRNKIDIDKIQQIEKVNNKYILKSDTKKIKIKLNFIEKESLDKLNNFLKELDLPSEKISLAN
ncbi:hypothetical protein ACFQ0R_13150 [Psychroflexus salinarum]|uniref:PH domain-containing protein n=1 Tax=Psychroflexus salinarum TaxID=546024 RepID=A0ABW3GSG0_9FLAO